MVQYVYIVSLIVTLEDMVEYKFVLMIYGVLFVVTSGITKLPV